MERNLNYTENSINGKGSILLLETLEFPGTYGKIKNQERGDCRDWYSIAASLLLS